MEEFFINDYLIIEDVDKIKNIGYMGFVNNYPYRVTSVSKNTATITNGRSTFIFTPKEMQFAKKATNEELNRAFTHYKDGDKLRVLKPLKMDDGSDLDVTIGKIYEIEVSNHFGIPLIIDDKGGKLRFLKSDLIFIERVNEVNDEDVSISELMNKFKIGDYIEIVRKEKIRSSLTPYFFLKKPYEIVAKLNDAKGLIIKNEDNLDMIIYGEELKHIKHYIDTKLVEYVEKTIEKLEVGMVDRNLEFMMNEALKACDYKRAEQIHKLAKRFNKRW